MAKKAAHVSETPATQALRRAGVPFSEHVYDYVDRGGTAESARQLGVDEHAVVKTLVMQDDQGKPLIVLMHGDRQVSTKNLARAIGAKSVAPCLPEAAERASGYRVGGTSPFATRKPMPVYVEATILALERICINGGPARLPDRHRATGARRPARGEGRLLRLVIGAMARPGGFGAESTRPATPPASMTASLPLLAALAAYLAGSLSFAVIVSRAMGLSDPRSYGSGNPGATNVLRSGNKAAAILTLALDALKGWLPVALVVHFGGRYGLGDGTVALVALAAFLGHLWPVFFRFQGGKGVATAAGALLGIDPLLGGATLLTWVIIAAFFRYSSLASIVAAVFAPFWQLLTDGAGPIALAVVVMALLLVWRHAGNIRKLLAGKESRIGAKAMVR